MPVVGGRGAQPLTQPAGLPSEGRDCAAAQAGRAAPRRRRGHLPGGPSLLRAVSRSREGQ